MSKIALLKEQIVFLMGGETEAYTAVTQKMGVCLTLVQEKMAVCKDQERKETFERIAKSIQSQMKALERELKEDIAVLDTQLQSVEEMSTIEDVQRREERAGEIIEILYNFLSPEGGNLLSMEKFKERFQKDAAAMRNNFFPKVDDWERSIHNGEEDLLLLLFTSPRIRF